MARKTIILLVWWLFAASLAGGASPCKAKETAAAKKSGQRFQKVIFGCYSENPGEFEVFARRAKQEGATHIVLTAEDLPWARWQYDTAGDPYPAWAISNVGFLKIAVPEALKPYIPQDYAQKVMDILEQRCEVLRKYGLKGAFTTFEPQMLPGKVFEDHPLWRGPQVDHPLRSRVPRFAPCIDNPEVLALYRESIRKLLERCPEIEVISLHTNDSGSGMSWSQGLYPGRNGNTRYKHRKMYERYHDFFHCLREGARDAGVKELEIDAVWVRERDPELIAAKLKRGMAISNREGPDGREYKSKVGFLLDYFYPYYPARGIPFPVRFLEELEKAYHGGAPRVFVLIGDRFNKELYFRIYERFWEKPTRGYLARLGLLKEMAAEQVGQIEAETLLDVWLKLYQIQGDVIHWGGTILYMGCVQQRWLTRPFVPFPEELTPGEKDYYRPYLFQARTEERASNLHEIQGTHAYRGLGGTALSGRSLGRMRTRIGEARESIKRIRKNAGGEVRRQYELLDIRLQVLDCLANNCRNAIRYQYALDIIKQWDLRRPHEFSASLISISEWTNIRRVARNEIDNISVLIELLESTDAPLLDLAASKEEEDIRILGGDLVCQLRKKIRIMVAHWEDYERLFMKE